MIFGRVFKTVTLGLGLSLAAGSLSAATVIPQNGWKLLWTNSQELAAENGAAANAFDGNPTTIWHTEWSRVNKAGPHEIRIDLGNTYSISGFKYLPRPTNRFAWSQYGRIANYALYVSNSPTSWGTPAVASTFRNDGSEQNINFNARSGRYVRFVALSEVNGNPWASAAEINFLGSGGGAVAPTSGTDAAKPISQSTPSAPPITSYVLTAAPVQANSTAKIADDPVNWHQLVASAGGTVYRVSSKQEFNAVAGAVRPGDVVLIANGEHRWSWLNIPSVGTKERPIIYTAETPGGATFTGAESILFNITGSYNIIGGFKVKDNPGRVLHITGAQGPGTKGASNNRITDIEFSQNALNNLARFIEIDARSHFNRIDHSRFLRNYGIMRIEVDADAVRNGASVGTRIDHNKFIGDGRFGVNALQIGQGEPFIAGSSGMFTNVIFEHNLIKDFHGYGELVSNKASGNVIRFNEIVNSKGGIHLRYGNNCQVYGNLIHGTGGGEGIRIHGLNHKVYNNIINAPQKDVAIRMSRWGERTGTSNVLTTGNNVIVHNSIFGFVNYGMRLGDCDEDACNTVKSSLVANNLVAGSRGVLVHLNRSSGEIALNNNLFIWDGEATLGRGFELDPRARSKVGLQHTAGAPFAISSTSGALDGGTPIVGIDVDYLGNPRVIGSAPDMGAIEIR